MIYDQCTSLKAPASVVLFVTSPVPGHAELWYEAPVLPLGEMANWDKDC